MKHTHFIRYTLILSLVVTNIPIKLIAQISTVSDYNYYDLNRNAFSVDGTCLNIDQEAQFEFEYWYTMLELAKGVKNLFLNVDPNPSDKQVGNYILSKRDYTNQKLGGEHYSWVLVRPADDKIRPVVSITHGGKSSSAGQETVISLGVLDLVQRGYAVVFYQSAPSGNGNPNLALEDANFLPQCLTAEWSPDKDIACLQQAVYFRSQLSFAALQFTKAQSEVFNLDEELQFAAGFSGGGISTMYSTLMEDGDFDHSMITTLGLRSKYSLFPDEELSIKAVTSLSGGMMGEGTEDYAFGDKIFQNMDASIRFLFLHGQDDNAVLPNRGPLGWSNPGAEVPGSEVLCALDLDALFKTNGFTSKAVINCSGDHNLMTFPCDSDEDHFGNNPDFAALNACTKWVLSNNFDGFNFRELCSAQNMREAWPEVAYMLMQVHDFSKMMAYHFHQDFPDEGPLRVEDLFIDEIFSNDEPASVIPIDNPKLEEGVYANGHWEMSDKCLVMQCEGLYFNEEGFGNNLFYSGDYLTMNTSGLNLFDGDFTLELEFKAINNLQRGVLVSHLNAINLGFEVLINTDGVLQFKKTIGSPASLLGTTGLQDSECHTLGLVRQGNSFQIYVDGRLEDDANYNISFPNISELRIGNTNNELVTGKNGFNGVIRNFRIWNRSLLEEELGQKGLDSSTDNLEADFVFADFANTAYASSNGIYNLQFGNRLNDVDYDPKWFSDDEFCFCNSDVISSFEPTEEVDLEREFYKILPNPSRGVILIDINENLGSLPSKLEVYDLNGRLIQSELLSVMRNEINIREKGVFLVKISSYSRSEIQKIVIL